MPITVCRRFIRAASFAVALCVLFVAAPSRADVAIPKAPLGWVTDEAGLLSDASRTRLDAELRDYEKSSGHQVVVWIGSTIAGGDLATFAVKTFQAWKVGQKGHDDGVMMIVFAKDRTIDIEVGYGLEDRLTDALSHRIIDEVMAPRLRAGDADGAISSGVDAILADIEGHPVAAAPAGSPQNDQNQSHTAVHLSPTRMVVYGVLGLLFLLLLLTHPSLAMYFLFSIFNGGGGGGFGGGGGGGFSGGGGRSGGGGARGGW